MPKITAVDGQLEVTMTTEGLTDAPTTACKNDYCVSDEEYVDRIEDYLFPVFYEWFIIFLYIIVFVVGVTGNFLVCFAVARNRTMRTLTNCFIVNLAVADMLVLLVCLPPTVIEDVGQTWYIGRYLCKIIKYCQVTSVSVSVLTLTAISVERYFAICHPMKIKSTMNHVRVTISVIWIISLLISIPELLALDTYRFPRVPEFSMLLTSCRSSWDPFQQMMFQIFQMVALFFLPLGLTAFCYTNMAVVLWSNNIPTECGPGKLLTGSESRTVSRTVAQNAAKTQLQARKKVAKMLIAVVVIFGLCYLPVHLLNILRYAKALPKQVEAINVIPLMSHWLCYFNSCINPVIYNFMSAKFRKEFTKACGCLNKPSSTAPAWRRDQEGTTTYTFKYADDHSGFTTERITLGAMS